MKRVIATALLLKSLMRKEIMSCLLKWLGQFLLTLYKVREGCYLPEAFPVHGGLMDDFLPEYLTQLLVTQLRRKSLFGFCFFTAFIFYFKPPQAMTNSKYFSSISGELDNTKLVPLKLAALSVLEGPQAMPTPTEATHKAWRRLQQGLPPCPPQIYIPMRREPTLTVMNSEAANLARTGLSLRSSTGDLHGYLPRVGLFVLSHEQKRFPPFAATFPVWSCSQDDNSAGTPSRPSLGGRKSAWGTVIWCAHLWRNHKAVFFSQTPALFWCVRSK